MNFPVWDVGFGLPLLIAIVAIPHVFVAHFAVGGGLFLAIYETVAHRRSDNALLNYVRHHSRFFLLLTLVFGAITGVGIWLTIGLINPAGTSALIHLFVWFWATEWVMFIVEITAALVYYYGWDRMSPTLHRKVMWIYFAAAWGSLFVINGIITFMLTPGSWLQTSNIWHGFFNPTFLPSLIIRTLLTTLMAGLFAFITGSRLKDLELKKRVLRIASFWTLPSLILMIPVALWYYAALPDDVTRIIAGGWQALQNARSVAIWTTALLILGVIFSPLLRPRGMRLPEALILLTVGFFLFGSFEWYREAVRKPYVLWGYMYSTGLHVTDTTKVREAGLSATVKWQRNIPDKQGEDLYRAACASCHSQTGYNGLAGKISAKGWSQEHLSELVSRTGYMRGAMPPFVGTNEEAALIAKYLAQEAKKVDKKIPATDGDLIWQRNCGLCHTIDGHRQLRAVFSGMTTDDLKELLITSDELSDAMPPFFGDEKDAETLANSIEEWLKIPAQQAGGK